MTVKESQEKYFAARTETLDKAIKLVETAVELLKLISNPRMVYKDGDWYFDTETGEYLKVKEVEA